MVATANSHCDGRLIVVGYDYYRDGKFIFSDMLGSFPMGVADVIGESGFEKIKHSLCAGREPREAESNIEDPPIPAIPASPKSTSKAAKKMQH